MAQLVGVGRIGRDAETRFTAGGDAVTDISLAFAYGKKGDGDKYRPSQWVKATLWGKRGENIAPYLTKGKLVYVVLDDVHIREWDKDDGSTGFSLEGRVATIEFAGGESSERVGGERPAPQQRKPAESDPTHGVGKSPSMDDMEDDVPFD